MKKYLTQEEIDGIATRFISYRDIAQQDNSIHSDLMLQKCQNECIEKLKFLVLNKVSKYKKFSNYIDLEQDGYEALILALKTYQPGRGAFSWWANKYIGTRVSRAANSHSTIKIPLKKISEGKPYKTSVIPTMIDLNIGALGMLECSENIERITEAVKKLPEIHFKLINMLFGLNGFEQNSMQSILDELSISRTKFLKILKEAKHKIKKEMR